MRCPPHLGYGRLLPCSHLAASLSSTISSRPGISARACWRRAFSTPDRRASSASPTGGLRLRHLYGAVYRRQSAGAAGGQTGPPPDLYGGARLVRSFSLLMATQSSAEGVIFFRFLVGIGLGIELVTIDTYLSEWVPTHLRNKAFAFAFFIQFLSVPAVALMSGCWCRPPCSASAAGAG